MKGGIGSAHRLCRISRFVPLTGRYKVAFFCVAFPRHHLPRQNNILLPQQDPFLLRRLFSLTSSASTSVVNQFRYRIRITSPSSTMPGMFTGYVPFRFPSWHFRISSLNDGPSLFYLFPLSSFRVQYPFFGGVSSFLHFVDKS